MGAFSNHGTGVMIHGVERRPGGRVEFTSWLCVFWVPLLPLRSWSGVYLGEGPADATNDESHQFTDLRRVPHDWGRVYLTFTRSLLVVACAPRPPRRLGVQHFFVVSLPSYLGVLGVLAFAPSSR